MGFFDDIGDAFGSIGDLFKPDALSGLAEMAPALAAFAAPAALGAAGAAGLGAAGAGALEGGAALGAAEGGTALGFGGAEAATDAGLGSWFGGLGETGMAGGEGALTSGGSDLLALTAPEANSAWPGLGMEGLTSGGEGAPIGLAGDYSGATGAAEGSAMMGGDAASGPGLWDKLVTGATNQVMKNPLGIGMAGLGLAKSVLGGKQDSAELAALRGQAGQLGGQAAALNAQGQQLAAYLQSGTLPPGLQASVTAAADAYKARIIQNHAKNGMPTDPTQNSALAQELAQADLNAVMMTAQLGQKLLESGTQFLNLGMQTSGLSDKIYESLVRLDREQSANTGRAIANFASALSGGGGFKMAA